MLSGGVSSFEAARRCVSVYGKSSVDLWFADTKIEDEDLYRFLDDCESYLSIPIQRFADGRDVWGLFDDIGIIGNTRMDACSRILKRDLLRKELNKRDHTNTIVAFGLDWTEPHRIERVKTAHSPYECIFPVADKPYLTKVEIVKTCPITPPRLTTIGFPHNNCGGFCIKAGHAHFALLLREFPERYAYHEKREKQWQERHGKKNTVLRDRRKGKTTPLSLSEFRQRVAHGLFDETDWGGCGCFSGPLE